MIKTTEKWQIGLHINRDYRRMESGWNVFDFYLLKFVHFPQEGESIRKEHYKGIRLLFRFWVPIEKYY